MDVRERMLAALAGQLGHPSGIRGRVVGAMLNRTNRSTVSAAVDALSLATGAVAADVGFGGGVGLEVLLSRVGRSGQVHGIEVSETMLARASRRFRRDIADGRLQLHPASMTQLPLADGTLDGAITVNTIYFVPELDRACRELARVLSGSGRLVVGLADPDAMARIPFTAHGFLHRPMTEVHDVLGAAGFRILADRRVGNGDDAIHLLVAELAGRLPTR